MTNPAWSYSGLKDFIGCPRRFHEVKVLKNYPRQETEATRYGVEVHKAIEEYVRDKKPLYPFERFQPVVDALLSRQGRVLAEHQMALNTGLRPCQWGDETAWVRGVADVLIVNDDDFVAHVADWKTGNNKYPDPDQLELMALLTFAHFPHIKKVHAALIFLVKEDVLKSTIHRDQEEKLWWKWREKSGRLEAAYTHNVWNPRQSGLCKAHCPVHTCEFNGQY